MRSRGERVGQGVIGAGSFALRHIPHSVFEQFSQPTDARHILVILPATRAFFLAACCEWKRKRVN